MKITKTQLKQIIKEELAVILTNEEAGELFGEAVEAELEEKKGIKNPGKYIDGPRTEAGIDDDGDGTPNKVDSHPKDGAKNESMIQEDMEFVQLIFNAGMKVLANLSPAIAAGLIYAFIMGVGTNIKNRIANIKDDRQREQAFKVAYEANKKGKSQEEILTMLDNLIKKN